MLAKTKMKLEPSQECPQVDVNYEANSLLMIDCPEFSSHAKVKRMPFLGCGRCQGCLQLGTTFLERDPVDQGKPLQTRCLKRSFPLG